MSATAPPAACTLLAPGDPAPHESVATRGRSPIFLTCEHAGLAIPRRLGDLGLHRDAMQRHIACDIGADAVARLLSRSLDAPLVLQPYSRLVIDCNRPFGAPDCVPEVSDGTAIPGNAGLDENGRRRRFEAIHQPFHAEISRQLDARRHNILVAVHSFTPKLATQRHRRPWHAGLLFNHDCRLAHLLMGALLDQGVDKRIAFNQPYCVDELSDYTIPVHGERRGIAHLLLEIRNDEIADRAGRSRWADLLAAAFRDVLTNEGIV
jgi:predicted N-formylglutamate amidohydrolase